MDSFPQERARDGEAHEQSPKDIGRVDNDVNNGVQLTVL